MIELFAQLMKKREKTSITSIIMESMKHDRYIRDNAAMNHAMSYEQPGTENFYCIEDDYARIKQEVYYSYLIHKILLSMKRLHQEGGQAYVLVSCESENVINHILEDQLYRVIAQMQDAEYRVTGKTPKTFSKKPVLKKINATGSKILLLEIAGFGKLMLLSFNRDQHNEDNGYVVRNLMSNELKDYEEVTHFYKMGSLFRSKFYSPVDSFRGNCEIALETWMPETCVHYTFIAKNKMSKDSYASRKSKRLALQLNESNISLMSVLIKEIYKDNNLKYIEDGEKILDPVSSITETLALCSASDYETLIENMDKAKRESRLKEIRGASPVGIIRGHRAQSLWTDETRAQAYTMVNVPIRDFDGEANRNQTQYDVLTMMQAIQSANAARELDRQALSILGVDISRDGDSASMMGHFIQTWEDN